MLVVERDGEALDLGLAGRQVLDRGVRDRVGPGQLAAGSGAGRVGVLDRRQRAEDAPDRGAGGRDQCTSVRSTSVKVMVPLSVRLPAGVTCSVTAPMRSCAVITGASLVPVMVTSICGDQAAVWSSSVMVKVSTLVWPAARYSTAVSATV